MQRSEFLAVHHDASVAREEHDLLRFLADLGAEGGGQAVAHGAEAAGGDEVARQAALPKLGGPDLMLADVGGHDGVLAGVLLHLGDDVLRRNLAVEVAAGEGMRPVRFLQLLAPVLARSGVVGGQILPGGSGEGGQRPAQVAFDLEIGLDDLAEFARVDVEVYDFRMRRKGLDVAGHAVAEAAAHGEQQVALHDGAVGREGAVHADEAEVRGIAIVDGALAHERGHDGQLRLGDEAAQGVCRVGDDHAAADHEQGLFRLAQQPDGFPDAVFVAFFNGVGRGLIGIGEVESRLKDVLRDVDADGAGAAAHGQREGFAQHAGQVIRISDEIIAFADGPGDAGDVGLLKGILA